MSKVVNIHGFILIVLLANFSGIYPSYAQVEDGNDNQLWLSAYLNWKFSPKVDFNQDMGLQQALFKPSFSKLVMRSQISRGISEVFSSHGGFIFVLTYDELESSRIEIRPWVGGKARWPRIWRLTCTNYLRLEQRFIYEFTPGNWDMDFRFRYRLGTNIPVNRNAITDHTLFVVLSYELITNPVEDVEIKSRLADFHKFDVGLGYKFNPATRLELLLVSLDAYEYTKERYNFSDLIYQVKFRKYFNSD